MSNYVTIGFNDFQQSMTFYDAVFSTIGYKTMVNYEGFTRAYSYEGLENGFVIWVCQPFNKEPATLGNGTMVGLNTDAREKVDAFYHAALANGGTSEGAPGLRPYTDTWYGAYVRDPVGNKLSVFCDK